MSEKYRYGDTSHSRVARQRQFAGSIAQGIGGALYEHLVSGPDGTRGDSRAAHLPADPLGVRRVGEGGTLGPNSVLAGAVADAPDIEVDNLPITPSANWTEAQCSR